MPNRDGTGPRGKGTGTGRLRGGCAGSGNNANLAGRGQRSRNSGSRGTTRRQYCTAAIIAGKSWSLGNKS